MRILILADIHGNLPALEAVLATREAMACQQVISLGDHTGFGPCPRQVQQRLMALDAVMLRGNHEDRLLDALGPEFSGENWALLRWTAARLEGLPLDFPTDWRVGDVFMTHAAPGDPYRLMMGSEVLSVRAQLPPGVSLFLSGHNHSRWDVSAPGFRAVNTGALGMGEDGVGGVASFGVLDMGADGRAVSFTRHTVPYDLQAIRRAYIQSGAVSIAPDICRAALTTMETGASQLVLKLVRHAVQTAESLCLPVGDARAWAAAMAIWSWQDGLTTAAYWAKVRHQAG